MTALNPTVYQRLRLSEELSDLEEDQKLLKSSS